MAKKLIEVAPFLPLDTISTASRADKDKKTGTIKNVHKWFAPMPTPALRALIFATVVDAPDSPEETSELLRLIEELVPPDGNPPSLDVLEHAREAIRRSCAPGDLPTIYDPFCGGGSTLVEAQRLGLPAAGSDLNPVPVLITRTLTELVPQVVGRPPLAGGGDRLVVGDHPIDGLVADVKHYAARIRSDVWAELGHLYPEAHQGATTIAWLWAWTVPCTNPVCGASVPLISSFWLSKHQTQRAWLEPMAANGQVTFAIRTGTSGPTGQGTVERSGGAECQICSERVSFAKVRDFADTTGLGVQLLAQVLVDSNRRRSYVSADGFTSTAQVVPDDAPTAELSGKATINLGLYGFKTQADLFTSRQLTVLGAFADAIACVADWVKEDGGDEVYGRTIASLLGLALGKLSQSNSTQVRWNVRAGGSSKAEPAFGRHALPMVWDFAETNPFGGSVGDWMGQVDSVTRGLRFLPQPSIPANVTKCDARVAGRGFRGPTVVIADPPYFDQIGYADLSDYFYVWHRRALRSIHPDLYSTIVTPKDLELIATPFRHGGDKKAAAKYFVAGFTETFRTLCEAASSDNPIIVVYAHQQAERNDLGSASTGWDAMLEAILNAGLSIEGTLPIHGTYKANLIGLGNNALASYIVMVCRPRAQGLRPGDVASFRAALRQLLPTAVERLLMTGESMVDIRQAAIGPGMEIFCQFSSVYDGGRAIAVRQALTIINEELGHLLDEQLGDVDDETRWATQWYADHQYMSGDFDEARKLAQVFGLGVDGLADAGVVEQPRGKGVRLFLRSELLPTWNPALDDRIPVWEACQHLVLRLEDGVDAAGRLLRELGTRSNGVRQLAQYLANLAIDKAWAEDANAYDSLVKSWAFVEQAATDAGVDDGRLPGL